MYEEGTLPRFSDHRSFPPACGVALLTSATLCCPHVATPGPDITLSGSSTPPLPHQTCLLCLLAPQEQEPSGGLCEELMSILSSSQGFKRQKQ